MASILLLNTSFANMGDALMARAIRQELGPSHRYSISASLAFESPKAAREFDVCLVSDLPRLSRKRRLFNAALGVATMILAAVPGAARKKLGVARPRDVDLALDMSGYCFGDPWGEERVVHFTKVYRQLRAAGAKVVLMPRTWGPFETIRPEALQALIAEVDLAFARDQRSLAAIRGALDGDSRARIAFAPDYTHAVAARSREIRSVRPYACIIPNARVVDYQMSFNAYATLLAMARERLEHKGLRPILFLHEVTNDRRFLKGAAGLGFDADDVWVAKDELDAKAAIAGASAVVTSRLHGLYNALNSEVPVAVIAWSFKYREALEQYGCLDCLVDHEQPESSLARIVEMITDKEQADRLRSAMREGKRASAELSADMWIKIRKVARLVESKGSS